MTQCDCITWARTAGETGEHHPRCQHAKTPRLFYYEEAEDCWCPAEGLLVENIIDVDLFFSDGDTHEIRFKREDMTDAEFAAIPDA